MNNHMTFRHLNLAAATAVGFASLALTAASGTAQKAKPMTLAQAVVVEVYEHNLGKAMKMYRQIIADEETAATDRARACLRLGMALRRVGEVASSEAILKKLASGKSSVARQAASILSGAQDDGDLVKAKVQQALAAMRLTGRHNKTDLLWIGAPAVPYVLAAVRKEKRDLRFLSNASRVLFHLGGKEVASWIDKVSESKDVLRKRAIIKAAGDAQFGVRRLFAKMMKDPDSTVRREMIQADVASVPQLLNAAAEDSDPEIRALAFRRCVMRWNFLDHAPGGRLDNFSALAAQFSKTTKLDRNSTLYRWLSPQGQQGMPVSGGRIPRTEDACRRLLPLMLKPAFQHSSFGWPLPDGAAKPDQFIDEIQAILKVWGKRKFDPADPGYASIYNTPFVSRAIQALLSNWGSAAVPVVLDAMAFGYLNEVHMGPWFEKRKNIADARLFLKRIRELNRGAIASTARWVAGFRYSESDLPLLAAAIDHFDSAGNEALRKGKAMRQYVGAVTRIGTSKSIDFIVKRQITAGDTSDLFRRGSQREEDLRILQELAQVKGSGLAYETVRRDAFLKLTGYSGADPAVFARAYALGITANSAGRSQPRRPRRSGYSYDYVDRGLVYVLVQKGMPAEQLAAVVGTCLAGGTYEAFYDVATGVVFARGAQPDPVLRVLAKFVTKIPAGRSGSDRGLRVAAMRRIFEGMPMTDRESVLIEGLRSEDPETRSAATAGLRRAPVKNSELVELVARYLKGAKKNSESESALRFLSRVPARLDVVTAAYRLVGASDQRTVHAAILYLVSKDPEGLMKATPAMLSRLGAVSRAFLARELLRVRGGEAVELVGGLVADRSIADHARKNIVGDIGSTMSLDAVPYLIRAMRQPELQKDARAQLESLRFYHQEKGRWDTVLAGGEFAEASAMLALIKQVRTGNQRVRIAAIRSLGVLGDPESLPFLVKLLGEKDPDVAAAAQDALDRIHAAPTAGVSGGKKGKARK